ncbi:hypothetical protein [Streptomyces akebiae]|nr:hypothetical protein [Streptomyces akebiae]
MLVQAGAGRAVLDTDPERTRELPHRLRDPVRDRHPDPAAGPRPGPTPRRPRDPVRGGPTTAPSGGLRPGLGGVVPAQAFPARRAPAPAPRRRTRRPPGEPEGDPGASTSCGACTFHAPTEGATDAFAPALGRWSRSEIDLFPRPRINCRGIEFRPYTDNS